MLGYRKMKILFWLSLIFIFYTYFGYPILLVILAKLMSKPVNKGDFAPDLTIIIAAYNEERTIGGKLENILGLSYPGDRLGIIVVSDASSDGTDSIVQSFIDRFGASKIKLIRLPERGGKSHALNAAVPEAHGDIIVFADARQLYNKNALRELVNNFHDETVGVVSGELHLMNPDGGGVGEGVGMYWKYEKLLRKMESRLYSTSGATGAIYSIRKELYRSIPDDTILDDVVIPLKVVLKGYRVVFEENAHAYDNVAGTVQQELTRKIRTLCGNYQAFIRMPELFNPFKNKVYFQLVSHKIFRLLVPFALFFMLASSAFLYPLMFYRIMLILQICLYMSAVAGHFLSKAKPSLISRLFGVPYTFVILNYAALAGLYRFVAHKQKAAWDKVN